MLFDVGKVARVVGGKTARACDSCIRKRARWYCAADDAFLCQFCDSLVHSANPLARRHERLRLNTASFKTKAVGGGGRFSSRVPYWQSRKTRTPRGKQSGSSKSLISDEIARKPFYLVPEIMSDETTSFDDGDRQLFYGRVPVFAAEKVADPRTENVSHSEEQRSLVFNETEMKGVDGGFSDELGFLQSEMDLEEFAADVETLLGKGLEDDSIGIDGLGLMQFRVDVDHGSVESSDGSVRVVKDEEEIEMEMASDDQPFELSFHFDEDVRAVLERSADDYDVKVVKKGKILLRLDYEGIMSAWDGSTPWGSRTRPEVDPKECWPSCMGTCGIKSHQLSSLDDHGMGTGGKVALSGDDGREARVSRYREKRRTRLFSKKIRYEVRKLNAEKRPRMKGRFVKKSPCSC